MLEPSKLAEEMAGAVFAGIVIGSVILGFLASAVTLLLAWGFGAFG